jgi:hypothetical protein
MPELKAAIEWRNWPFDGKCWRASTWLPTVPVAQQREKLQQHLRQQPVSAAAALARQAVQMLRMWCDISTRRGRLAARKSCCGRSNTGGLMMMMLMISSPSDHSGNQHLICRELYCGKYGMHY